MTTRPAGSSFWNPTVAINMLLVCVMVACLLMDLGRWFGVLLRGDFSLLVVFAFAAALEAQVTARLLDRGMALTRTWLQSMLLEAGLMILLMKAITLWIAGSEAALAEVRRWPTDFGNSFFATPFLFLCVFVGGAWLISRMLAADLMELESHQPIRGPEAVINPFEGQYRAQRNLTDLVMILGGAMIVFGILATYLVPYAARQINNTQDPLPATGSALGPEILIFFLCGFGLLSFARFAIQRSGWEYERIPVRRDLPLRWIKYCVVFLVLVTLLAVLLPSDYSAAFLSAVLQISLWIWNGIALLIALIMVPIAMFLAWWGSLF